MKRLLAVSVIAAIVLIAQRCFAQDGALLDEIIDYGIIKLEQEIKSIQVMLEAGDYTFEAGERLRTQKAILLGQVKLYRSIKAGEEDKIKKELARCIADKYQRIYSCEIATRKYYSNGSAVPPSAMKPIEKELQRVLNWQKRINKEGSITKYFSGRRQAVSLSW